MCVNGLVFLEQPQIDMTFTFFVFSLMVCAYMWSEKGNIFWVLATGFLTGIGALTKVLPSYAFYGFTLLALGLYKKDFGMIFSKKAMLSHLVSLLLPTFWILNTQTTEKVVSYIFRKLYTLSYLQLCWQIHFAPLSIACHNVFLLH